MKLMFRSCYTYFYLSGLLIELKKSSKVQNKETTKNSIVSPLFAVSAWLPAKFEALRDRPLCLEVLFRS